MSKKLSHTKNLLSDTISTIKEGYILLDEHFNYLFINDNAATLVKRNSDDLIGKNIWKEFPELVNESFYHNCHAVLKTKQPLSFIDIFESLGKWYDCRIMPS